jgi:hypothetical protein
MDLGARRPVEVPDPRSRQQVHGGLRRRARRQRRADHQDASPLTPGETPVKVPDTDRNRSWLGRIRYRMGFAGYPRLRLTTLAETGTHGLLGAALGSAADREEATVARRLLPLLRPGMLILLDRAFAETSLTIGGSTVFCEPCRPRPEMNSRTDPRKPSALWSRSAC